MIYSFMYDYAEGCHPDILKALEKTNYKQQLGYGEDEYNLEAQKLIKDEIKGHDAEVHFVAGGTLANLLVISSALRPYESVISAHTGHIAVHETGAIENTGHKINEIHSPSGKLTTGMISDVLEIHIDEHSVVPRIVYISNATELGNIYTKNEIEVLSKFCKEKGLLLFMDGARLGTALTAKKQDLKIEELKNYFDAFYIGGTKNGALIGEAIVLINDELKKKFRFSMKQKGGLLAKGRLLGLQFRELFRDGLYYKNAIHANELALKLAKGMEAKGYKFLSEPETNMIFPILSNELVADLEKNFLFHRWLKYDDKNTVIRLVTSWATKEENVDEFLKYM